MITVTRLKGINIQQLMMRHVYEFYQLLPYTDDVDLNAKLEEWGNFYNFNRPHGSFNGKHPMKH